jgi:predicted DNA-binding transcriptional regulator AlpA
MPPKKPKRYLSRPEVAERIGVLPDTLNKYKLPEPDALIGRLKGWLPETIDAWNDARPSKSSIYARMADTTPRDDTADDDGTDADS